jgi:hypothetical protein
MPRLKAISVFASTMEQELLYATTAEQVPFCATTVELKDFSPRLGSGNRYVPRL